VARRVTARQQSTPTTREAPGLGSGRFQGRTVPTGTGGSRGFKVGLFRRTGRSRGVGRRTACRIGGITGSGDHYLSVGTATARRRHRPVATRSGALVLSEGESRDGHDRLADGTDRTARPGRVLGRPAIPGRPCRRAPTRHDHEATALTTITRCYRIVAP
jgi:hypothetical protein